MGGGFLTKLGGGGGDMLFSHEMRGLTGKSFKEIKISFILHLELGRSLKIELNFKKRGGTPKKCKNCLVFSLFFSNI